MEKDDCATLLEKIDNRKKKNLIKNMLIVHLETVKPLMNCGFISSTQVLSLLV